MVYFTVKFRAGTMEGALEYLTIFGATAILGFLAYITAVGLYAVDNYGKTADEAAFGTGEYEVIKIYAQRYMWIQTVPRPSTSWG